MASLKQEHDQTGAELEVVQEQLRELVQSEKKLLECDQEALARAFKLVERMNS
jgi:hypothetical protein